MSAKIFTKKNKKLFVWIVVSIIVTILFFIIVSDFFSLIKKNTSKKIKPAKIEATAPITPTTELKDNNDMQLLHARANGLEMPYISNENFEEDSAQMVSDKKLVHLSSNPLYYIKEMDYSYPFVVPAMASLLDSIGTLFQQNLPDDKRNQLRFVITSGLRTNETQQNLGRHNRNATTVSTHLFGTTVDISYRVFYDTKTDTLISDYAATQALTKTMQALRYECKLATVRERHQACFHTTVVVYK